MRKTLQVWLPIFLLCVAVGANAQSFRVQCPTSTVTHPDPANTGVNSVEPTYTGPTVFGLDPKGGYQVPTSKINGAIKCQQVSGGDGYATMGDGTQTFMFSFGPLSGLADIAAGKAGTQFPNIFNSLWPGGAANPLQPGDPATTDGASAYAGGWGSGGAPEYAIGSPAFTWNGAVGLTPDVPYVATIYDISESGHTVTAVLNTLNNFNVGDKVKICGTGTTAAQLSNCTGPYDGTWTVTANTAANSFFPANFAFQFTDPATGLADVNESATATAASTPQIDGHVDPRQIEDIGVMNGNIPAPLVAFDEDDELFLTLTNVGMIMRPDLFEQHTIHFHGYPNASSFYDGVPDASVAINIGGSFTYYYLAPDAGTYFWHCHITPPEHLQMGMVGQLYVRPRQNRVPTGTSLYTALTEQQADLRTACRRPGDGLVPAVTVAPDILCSTMLPAVNTGAAQGSARGTGSSLAYQNYAYNDGDGSTAYDVEYPLQIHGFDPNFHFVGMTFNPEAFADMKDKYFLLNGRSYPDTVTPGPQATQSSDGRVHYSQPLPAIINIPAGGKALLRISDLSVSEYSTLQSLGIPMKVVGFNAKLLRDQAGNNTEYYTNSITLGGGESLDVELDASDAGCGTTGCAAALYKPGSVFYLYTPQLDHLSNDAENFGGLMTEVHICNSVTGNTFGNSCN
jgi:FtsP/CotA-like multicopper oxidase with cupredoxin domain